MPRPYDTGQLRYYVANHFSGHLLESPCNISKIQKIVTANISSFSLERLAWDRQGLYNNVTWFGEHHLEQHVNGITMHWRHSKSPQVWSHNQCLNSEKCNMQWICTCRSEDQWSSGTVFMVTHTCMVWHTQTQYTYMPIEHTATLPSNTLALLLPPKSHTHAVHIYSACSVCACDTHYIHGITSDSKHTFHNTLHNTLHNILHNTSQHSSQHSSQHFTTLFTFYFNWNSLRGYPLCIVHTTNL